ncbi:hypothetical protein N9P65_01845 [Alphaproteobacteria bacterium]|nr:hypothetical protein [Alphaproteobacteria bacterium]
MTFDAYFVALEPVGPVWSIAQSQGGNLALEAAFHRPELFKGVNVI